MPSFGQYYAVPVVARYQQRYPSVSVDLTLSQRVPDLLTEGYDVSLQLAKALPDSMLVSRLLCRTYSILCASPKYLAKAGVPLKPADLAGHHCSPIVTTIFPSDRWVFDGPDGEETFVLSPAKFQVNVFDTLAVALREGMGIGALPTSTALPALRDGTLVRVMPGYRLQPLDFFALYSSRLTFRTSRTQFGANFVASPAGGRRLPGRRVA